MESSILDPEEGAKVISILLIEDKEEPEQITVQQFILCNNVIHDITEHERSAESVRKDLLNVDNETFTCISEDLRVLVKMNLKNTYIYLSNSKSEDMGLTEVLNNLDSCIECSRVK